MEEAILEGVEVIGLVGWWNGWAVVEGERLIRDGSKDRDFLAVVYSGLVLIRGVTCWAAEVDFHFDFCFLSRHSDRHTPYCHGIVEWLVSWPPPVFMNSSPNPGHLIALPSTALQFQRASTSSRRPSASFGALVHVF
jgi:hypothetical protein